MFPVLLSEDLSMHIKQRLHRSTTRLRRRYRPSAGWVVCCRPRRSTTPNTQSTPAQLDIFGLADTSRVHRIRPRFSKKKPKKKTKGYQYSIRLKVRTTDRKIAYRSKAPKEHLLRNEERFSDDGIRRLHYALLVGSLITLKDHAEIGSARAAEIWLWIEREGHEAFSFDACVQIASELSARPDFRDPFPELDIDLIGAEPESLRQLARRLVRRNFGELPPHAGLLRRGIRAAEAGDPDALAWCLSDTNDALGFPACCDALGFEPEDVRAQLKRPLPSIQAA